MNDLAPIRPGAAAHPEIMRNVGDIAHEIIRDLRFQRNAGRVHALGPRVMAALLAEIGADRSIQTIIEQKLERYAAIDPDQLSGVLVNDWPSPVLRAVKEGE